MDKIWWNELWMSWPLGPHYAASSNVDNAHRLQGDLLLIVGEMDTNVDPASTYQVVDALIDAGKNFDLLVIPGRGIPREASTASTNAAIFSSNTCSASIRRTGTRSPLQGKRRKCHEDVRAWLAY